MKAFSETQAWLDKSDHASKEEFASQQKEAEGVCSPILKRMYQGQGQARADSGAAPMDTDGSSSSGPTVEEVDD